MPTLAPWIDFNSALAYLLYWAPLAFCAVGYFARTWRLVNVDKKARKEGKFYIPSETIGSIIGRGVVSVTPVANILAAVFDLSPEVFGRFFRWVKNVFNQPIVPKRAKNGIEDDGNI